MGKAVLSAVLADDLKAVLQKLQLLESVEEGRVFCVGCGTPVSLQNLQFLKPDTNGQPQFVCDSPECVNAFLAKAP